MGAAYHIEDSRAALVHLDLKSRARGPSLTARPDLGREGKRPGVRPSQRGMPESSGYRRFQPAGEDLAHLKAAQPFEDLPLRRCGRLALLLPGRLAARHGGFRP